MQRDEYGRFLPGGVFSIPRSSYPNYSALHKKNYSSALKSILNDKYTDDVAERLWNIEQGMKTVVHRPNLRKRRYIKNLLAEPKPKPKSKQKPKPKPTKLRPKKSGKRQGRELEIYLKKVAALDKARQVKSAMAAEKRRLKALAARKGKGKDKGGVYRTMASKLESPAKTRRRIYNSTLTRLLGEHLGQTLDSKLMDNLWKKELAMKSIIKPGTLGKRKYIKQLLNN